MAAHCSICAWKLARAEEPGGPQCVGLQRAGHDRVTEHTAQSGSMSGQGTWSSTLTGDADSRVRSPCDGGRLSLGSCEAVWMENTRRAYSSVCVCAHLEPAPPAVLAHDGFFFTSALWPGQPWAQEGDGCPAAGSRARV